MRCPTWSSESSLTWVPVDVDDFMANLKSGKKAIPLIEVERFLDLAD
ncbi:MAG: hypothetical protein U9P36_12880 [Thermodesulfobacteriota bacterium]|nr:hypothetical protein [Thermodesulfobacteriota bacterium]